MSYMGSLIRCGCVKPPSEETPEAGYKLKVNRYGTAIAINQLRLQAANPSVCAQTDLLTCDSTPKQGIQQIL